MWLGLPKWKGCGGQNRNPTARTPQDWQRLEQNILNIVLPTMLGHIKLAKNKPSGLTAPVFPQPSFSPWRAVGKRCTWVELAPFSMNAEWVPAEDTRMELTAISETRVPLQLLPDPEGGGWNPGNWGPPWAPPAAGLAHGRKRLRDRPQVSWGQPAGPLGNPPNQRAQVAGPGRQSTIRV